MVKLFQKRLILLILVVLIFLNAVVVGGSRLILLDSFSQLERQAVRENLLRVTNAVRNDAEALGTICADWSVWDDSYEFLQDGNQDYVESNLVDSTLVDLSLNALLYFDAQGQLFYGKGMNLDEETPVPPPAELLDYFTQRQDLWPPQSQSFSRQDGLLVFPRGPMLLSYRPILTSQGEGPAQGMLVMARWFNDTVIAQLAERTALTISLRPLTNGAAETQPVELIQVAADDPDTILGEVLLHDLEERPAFHLMVAMERDLFKQGQSTVVYFQLSFLLISLSFGLLLYLLIIISRKKHAAAEKRFRYVCENTSDGLFVVENSDRIVFINPVAKKLLGVETADLQQAAQVCFAHSGLGELIVAGLSGKVAGPVELSLPGQKSVGRNHLRAYVAPLVGEDGNRHGAMVTLRDVTQEIELEQLKNEFIASAAHEFNTPLSVIIGYSDLLLYQEYTDKEEQREYYALINDKAHALEKIVNDLLHLGKMESGREIHLEKISYNLSASIRRIIGSFRKESPQHRFIINLPEEDLEVVADQHRIGQVLDNLLSNAVKYSPDGGDITVSGRRAGDEFVLCVADQGVGLSQAQAEQAFEKFYRVDNSATAIRGLGLGLNIARNIIEIQGGRIWLESVLGEGTQVYFSLPCE